MRIYRLLDTALLCFIYTIPPALATEEKCSISPKPLFLRLANCTIPPSRDYPDGVDSWGIRVALASPQQDLCLVPSLVVNNTVIMATEICASDNSSTLSQCISRRGGLFNENETSSDFSIASQANLAPDPVWSSFNPQLTNAGNTTIQFASDVSLTNYTIALALTGQNSSISQLGLGNDSVFLREIVGAGLSQAAGFGLLAGSQSVQKPRDGHIVFGAYDAASLAGPFSNFTIRNTTTAGSRVCSLQVDVEKLTLIRPGVKDLELISGGTPMTSCIEPLDNLFRLPLNVLTSFQQNTAWRADNPSVSDKLLVVEPGLYYNSNFNGTLRFSLKDGPVVEIPNEELAQPVRALDPSGKMVLQNNITEVNVFNQEAPEGTAVLGKVFLSQLYLIVNYELQQFQLAPAVTESVVSPVLVPFENSDVISCPARAPDNTYIGVIVLGCALAVILIIVILLWVRHLKNQKKERPSATIVEPEVEGTGKCVANVETYPIETSPPQTSRFEEPAELHDRPRGSVATELDPTSEASGRRFSDATGFSRTLSNAGHSYNEISPIPENK